jgi:hypothetical protein
MMKKQQNMKKLRHEVWNEKEGMYIKTELPEEPKIKIRMCLDVLAYRSHKPYVQLSMREEWYANLGPSKQLGHSAVHLTDHSCHAYSLVTD